LETILPISPIRREAGPVKARPTSPGDAILGIPLRPVARVLARLNATEREVLFRIIHGKDLASIALELGIEECDAERHRCAITSKLRG
jgi:DNA-binding NarL/FixJ family response regulator